MPAIMNHDTIDCKHLLLWYKTDPYDVSKAIEKHPPKSTIKKNIVETINSYGWLKTLLSQRYIISP